MVTKARGTSLRRTVRRVGGKIVRRLALLPGGMPDGLGQDDELLGTTLEQTVMVYFADTPDALYQIEQWYPTFRALDAKHPVVIVLKDSRTARAVRAKVNLPVIVVARYTTIDDLLSRSSVKLALYVNHNPENFSNLRFGQLVHVSLMHGDSDKTVTVSNQTKAYDFSFVAGQAAIDRMATYSALYDAASRCIAVGRPQVDEQTLQRQAVMAAAETSSRRTVLYAPTWEGAQPSAAYGSVESHGPGLVRALLEDGRYRVVYRPHPLTGVRLSTYGDADRAIRALIEAAADASPTAGHRVDVGVEVATSFASGDVLVCDVSGVAMDWLPSGKPLVVTRPVGEEALIARTPLTELVPSLEAQDVDAAVDLLTQQLENDPLVAERARLTEYYLGDITPGASTRRFVEACDHLIEVRDQEMDRIALARAGR